MADPLGAAGADLVEALVRGAMTSPYAAADPDGGHVVARLIEQLAQRDSSRVGRLLSPTAGAAQFEVEVHRTGDIVPEAVLRDLSPIDALREAVSRAGDPTRSVELVVVPGNGEDEVILASRPGEPLAYLFADDVRAAAASLPAPPPPVAGAPLVSRFTDEQAAVAPAPMVRSEAPEVAARAEIAAPASSEVAATAGDLSTAIESALAQMSIQVDLAGVAELVQEAVIDHLRAEPLGSAAADPDTIANRVAAQLGDTLANGGLSSASLRDVLLELTETIALRDRRLGMEQQRMQMQLESLHASIQHAERAMTSALDDETRFGTPALGTGAAPAGAAPLDEFADRLESTQRSFDDLSRDLVRQGDDVRREVAMLARSIEDQIQVATGELGGRAQRSESTASDRRTADELARVADRLDSMVRHLDQSVDLRALGRLTRSIERAAVNLGVGNTPPGTIATATFEPLPDPAPTETADAEPEEPRADKPAAPPKAVRPRARIKRPAADHPLRLVDRDRSAESPGA